MSSLVYSLLNLPIRMTAMYHATNSSAGSLYRSRFTSLQRSKRESDKGKCASGSRRKDAAIYTYRPRTDRFLFHRCECGTEWTEHKTDIAPTDPATSNEVTEVHNQLATFEGSIAERL